MLPQLLISARIRQLIVRKPVYVVGCVVQGLAIVGFGVVGLTLNGTIAAAAFAGKVETLLVEADRVIPGKLNFESRNTSTGKRLNTEVDDMLDDLSEHVLKTGGEVIIVPPERMPTQTGAAAIYRF